MFSPDDLIFLDGARQATSKKYLVPRDNVIFEFGLFMGRLGREHTFCIVPKDKEKNGITLRIPSDLHGMTYAEYTHRWKPIDKVCESMKKPAKKIVDTIVRNNTSTSYDMKNKAIVVPRSEIGI